MEGEVALVEVEGGDRGGHVIGPELELVVAAEDVLREVIAAEAEVQLVAVRPVIVDVPRGVVGRIMIPGQVRALGVARCRPAVDGNQLETAVGVDSLEVQVQIADYLVEFALEDAARPDLIPVGLGSLLLSAPVRSSPFLLVVILVEEVEPGARGDLEVQPGVSGDEPGLIRGPDQGPGGDVLDTPGAVEPELLFEDRAAEVGAVEVDAVDPRGRVADVFQGLGNVVGLPGLVLDVHIEGSGVGVAASLGHQVELDAARLRLDVVVAVVDLHLVVAGDVDVGWRRAQGRVVGDVAAVYAPGGVPALAAVAVVRGLLSALVAADVLPVDQHAGHEGHEDPGIAGRGQAHQRL